MVFNFCFADAIAPHIVTPGIVDYLVIGVYVGIGFYLKHFADTGEFFLAGREMTAWIAGLAFISAKLFALELLGFPPPREQQTVLFNLHAGIWWGVIMLILGIFYTVEFRP